MDTQQRADAGPGRGSNPAPGGAGRGRGAPVPARGSGRGKGPSAGNPTSPGATNEKQVSSVRRSQGLGKTLMSRQVRKQAANTERAAREDAHVAGSGGWAGGAGQGAAMDTDEGLAGTFTKDLPAMMYGFGDDPTPIQETVDVVESALLQYLSTVTQRAMTVAQGSLKQKLDEKDVMFVVRKDPAKYARIKELLTVKELIQEARASVKEGTKGA